MSKTIHRDKYTIRNRTTPIEDDVWNLAFKRNKQNEEKNRFKREQRKGGNDAN